MATCVKLVAAVMAERGEDPYEWDIEYLDHPMSLLSKMNFNHSFDAVFELSFNDYVHI